MSTEDKIIESRKEKVKNLNKMGVDPYPNKINRSFSIAMALDKFSELEEKKEIDLVGRIMAIRDHGKFSFFDIKDESGNIQGFIGEATLGPDGYSFFQDHVDRGDFIEVKGNLFKTKTDEPSIKGRDIKILSKSLRPLPSEWYGLEDVEKRYRKRYLDLVLNPEVKEKFEIRFKTIKAIREFLQKEGFQEVDTPILQPRYGGAQATPFITHHEALDTDLYLRIAPELYLKRLLIGGFEKVFEIGKNFRNEGMDKHHNPEFTSLEFYCAYANYKELMKLAEDLFCYIVKETTGKEKITYQEEEIDFSQPWERIEFTDLLVKHTDIKYDEYDREGLKKKAEELGVNVDNAYSKPEIADRIYKKHCRPHLQQPTFLIHHPIGFQPLAKTSKKDPTKTDNFLIVIAGAEVTNAFCEQNNPLTQREVFEEQEKNYQEGSKEAQRMNKEFLKALEYGMPPAVGFGMGVDRLITILTNSKSIREVILFPTMKNNK